MYSRKLLIQIFLLTALSMNACNNVDVIDRLDAAKNNTFGWMVFPIGGTALGNFLSPNVQISNNTASCNSLSGIAKANCACAAEASFISSFTGLKGTFRAWISITGSVDAICNVTGGSGTGCEVPDSAGPFTVVRQSAAGFKQVIAANTYSELASTGFSQPVGEGGSSVIWTGTKADGRASGSDCAGFTSTTSATGTAGGQGFTGTNWTSTETRACSISAGLYCVR